MYQAEQRKDIKQVTNKIYMSNSRFAIRDSRFSIRDSRFFQFSIRDSFLSKLPGTLDQVEDFLLVFVSVSVVKSAQWSDHDTIN